MRALLLGAGGFIGSAVHEALEHDYEVYAASKEQLDLPNAIEVDLTSPESILHAIERCKPDYIVNCAGIVENTESASLNVIFTRNLLNAILASGLEVKKIVISGSAAEYGTVADSSVPIREDAPIRPVSMYGKAKAQETALALEFGREHNISVVVARIFNPIGLGMKPKFLIPNILQQIEKIKSGGTNEISLSRADSTRDYIHVNDIAGAIKTIIENTDSHGVYNVGSGNGTSNGKLVELLVENCGLTPEPRIIETADEPESPVASIADISRMQSELGWNPLYTIEKTVEEIVDAK